MNGYNSQKYLKEAIDSVYAQTFTNWEIIFIDNCSTDDTKKIVDNYDSKIKYYKTEKNIPLGEARNYGLKFCKGEYLAFLDTDDIWMKNKLEKQISVMDSNFEYQMCYSGVIYIDENSTKKSKFLPTSKNGDVFANQLRRYEINMQSVVIRNNIDICFDQSMQFSPDFDLFMKIASKYKVAVIKDYLVKYRKLTNSLTSQKIDKWAVEMKQTLDNIFTNKKLKDKYLKEYKFAYAKVSYNKARYLISINNKKDANIELSKHKFIDIKYFSLYLLSLFPSLLWNFVHKHK